ncbi:hypothetical protein, partial [Salmonella sp. SAL4434]|uniref:hypothetical protein n=1 Tax=Salmonella sp. SAL4434 TaxID=3159889 RepID=UPI00397CF8FE
TGEHAKRHPASDEAWEIVDGRLHVNGQWVFLKTGKLLRGYEKAGAADGAIRDIDVLAGRLGYNNFSLNISPDVFDRDGDGRIDADRKEAYA